MKTKNVFAAIGICVRKMKSAENEDKKRICSYWHMCVDVW